MEINSIEKRQKIKV